MRHSAPREKKPRFEARLETPVRCSGAPPGSGRGAIDSLRRLARPRPEEGVALAALVFEQVGVDRGVEGRIVELEGDIVASLFGAARPGGADLDAPGIDA